MSLRRLAFDEIDPDLRTALEPRVRRLGYFGEYFACAAHVPKAVVAAMALIEALKAPLSFDLVETIALTVSARLGADYERVQHERLALANGLPPTWIGAVLSLDPALAPGLDDRQRATQRFVLAYLDRDGPSVDTELDALIASLDDTRAVAIMLLTGSYASNALFMNALRLRPPAASIFQAAE